MLCPSSHKVFSRLEFGILLRLVNVIHLILVLSHPLNIQWRELHAYESIKKNLNVGYYSDIYRPVCFKLGMMIETTRLYLSMSVG